MKASSPVDMDAPIMIAWENYKRGDDYANSFKWAEKPQHRSGSMWAAFEAGWRAAVAAPETKPGKSQA